VTIDEILREDLDAPHKLRHTVKRVFDRLIDEHDAQGVTYSMVRAYIFQRRPEIRVEEGRGPPQAFVPQTHRPGDEAEVDFGDVWIHLDGVSTKVVRRARFAQASNCHGLANRLSCRAAVGPW
jgi:hypothetical protein